MRDTVFLQLLRLASPALPVGGFSYSDGLEPALEAGLVTDGASASDWLSDQLHLGLARADLPVLVEAHAAWSRDVDEAPDTLRRLNDWFLATRETAEFRQQALQMGRSMAECLRQDAGADDPRLQRLLALPPAPAWPLAFALALQRAGASAREGALAFAFAWSENVVQAAVKAVPLGQSAGQRLLARLAREVPAAVDEALARAAGSNRQAFTPMLAILSAQHETQYSRLFRS